MGRVEEPLRMSAIEDTVYGPNTYLKVGLLPIDILVDFSSSKVIGCAFKISQAYLWLWLHTSCTKVIVQSNFLLCVSFD